MTRRTLLASAVAIPGILHPDEIASTGTEVPELRPFDDTVRSHMAERGIPGGALCVVRNGRLILARGYGIARKEGMVPVKPNTLFRLASVSKPITGVGVLVAQQKFSNRFSLDSPVVPLLKLEPFLAKGAALDPRIRQITVRHLLQHTAGFDRDKSGDQMFKHFEIARDMGVDSPPDHKSLIRWGLGKPLDFDPGTKYAYSNFGYCILGRVIEEVSGEPYDTFVRTHVLKPMGISDMWVGSDRQKDAKPNEAHYYDSQNRIGGSQYSSDKDAKFPLPYAFASPKTMDAHGGWIANVKDLARFARGIDASRILSPVSIAALLARPAGAPGVNDDGNPRASYYGLGWQVRPSGANGNPNIWHTGGMPGTSSLLVRLGNGMAWAVVFNQRTDNPALPDSAIDGALHKAAAQVKRWPTHDLFVEG